jgi:hypothetical protein
MTSDNPKVVARGVNLTGTHFRESYKVDYGLGDDAEGRPEMTTPDSPDWTSQQR